MILFAYNYSSIKFPSEFFYIFYKEHLKEFLFILFFYLRIRIGRISYLNLYINNLVIVQNKLSEEQYIDFITFQGNI